MPTPVPASVLVLPQYRPRPYHTAHEMTGRNSSGEHDPLLVGKAFEVSQSWPLTRFDSNRSLHRDLSSRGRF